MGRRLDRRVAVFERRFELSSTGNRRATGEALVLQVAASFEPLSDGERWQAGAVEHRAEARFVLSASARARGITGEHFLRFEGADWEITGVKETGRRRWVELTAWRVERGAAR